MKPSRIEFDPTAIEKLDRAPRSHRPDPEAAQIERLGWFIVIGIFSGLAA